MSLELKLNRTNWRKVKLGEVATEYSKRISNPSESEYDRFVGNSNIGQWDFRVPSWEPTSSVTSAMKLFQPNDYLLVRRSLYASDFRERAPRADFPGVCSGDILTIRERPEYIADGFLIGVLNSTALWKYVVANASGSITRRIKWRDLANYEFLLPPKEQQAEISELLWRVYETYEAAKKLSELARTNYVVQREGLFFCPQSKTPLEFYQRLKADVAATLKFDVMGKYLQVVKYGTSKKGNSDKRGYPVLGIPNVISEKLSTAKLGYVELETEKEFRSCKLNKGDILIVRTNGNPDYTGRSALFDIDGEYTFASYLIKVAPNKDHFSSEFLTRYLQTNIIQRYFRRHATSTAGNYNINTETIKSVPVPLLSLSEQQSIVTKLRGIEKINTQLNEHYLKVRILQKSITNQVF